VPALTNPLTTNPTPGTIKLSVRSNSKGASDLIEDIFVFSRVEKYLVKRSTPNPETLLTIKIGQNLL
jgi:hypothetical protein